MLLTKLVFHDVMKWKSSKNRKQQQQGEWIWSFERIEIGFS